MKEPNKEVVRKRRHLSAEEKYQIFLEAAIAKGKGEIGEVVRRWGIHTSDLTRIRMGVEKAAISEFKTRKSRKPKIDSAPYEELKAKKEQLEATVLEQAAELALLKTTIVWVRWRSQRYLRQQGDQRSSGRVDYCCA